MKNILLISSVLLLGGCANCLDKVYATEVGITQAYETNYNLLYSEVIDLDTSLNLTAITDVANTASDAAANLCTIDEAKALDLLEEAGVALKEANRIIGEAQ